MNTMNQKTLYAALLSLGLIVSSPAFAKDTALPSKPQAQTEVGKSVQPQVDAKAMDQAAERRKKVAAEAVAALSETQNALKLLDEKKTGEALAALERATGKLELILSRDPKLALAPFDVQVVSYDLIANQATVKAVIKEAVAYLQEGEIQKARPLLANLASEIQVRTTNIPLATYPTAIKAVAPLIDQGKIGEAKAALQAALNTLVVTTDVIPLPVVRAEALLKKAEALAENEKRAAEESNKLAQYLKEARNQLQMAELLGYGNKKVFKPMYEQLDQIEKKTANGKGGKGWFGEIKKRLSDLM